MEAIKLPMKRGRMEDIGDEEVCLSEHVDMYSCRWSVCLRIHVQGNSLSTQSEETGSTTAMMDIDSMSSQVWINGINMFTISDMWMLCILFRVLVCCMKENRI